MTRHEPLFHQPNRHANDDGNGRGGALGSPCGGVRMQPEDVRRELDQLSSQRREPVDVPLAITIVEEDGLPLHIAEIA